METQEFKAYAVMARQASIAEQAHGNLTRQRKSLDKLLAKNPGLGMGADVLMSEMEARAAECHKVHKAELRHRCTDARVKVLVKSTLGLGPACYFFLGMLPKWIAEFDTVGQLWAYCGLHVLPTGRAPRMNDLAGSRGERNKGGWSPRLKSIALAYLAGPCIRFDGHVTESGYVTPLSPYRLVYDARRAHTEVTQPEWTGKHHDNDAKRIVAKAILRDLWLVSRGMDPKF